MKVNPVRSLALTGLVCLLTLAVGAPAEAQHKRHKMKHQKHEKHLENPEGLAAFERAYEAHKAGNYGEAISAFEQAAELGFKPGASMYNMACGYALQNDLANARHWLERAVDAGFSDLELLERDGDLTALRAEPGFQQFAETLLEKARVRKAEKIRGLYDDLRAESSEDGKAWLKVGTKLLALQEYPQALDALAQATRFIPQSDVAHYNLACAYALSSRSADALASLDRAIEAGFDDAEHITRDADLQSLRGDSRFEALVAKVRALDMGDLLHGGNDARYGNEAWAEAIETLQDVLAQFPNSGRAWFNLGLAQHYNGRFADGVAAFEKAVEIGFNDKTARYNIACGHAKQGHVDLAFEWLAKARDAGFEVGAFVAKDSDLEILRDDARFEEYRKLAEEHQRKMRWNHLVHTFQKI